MKSTKPGLVSNEDLLRRCDLLVKNLTPEQLAHAGATGVKRRLKKGNLLPEAVGKLTVVILGEVVESITVPSGGKTFGVSFGPFDPIWPPRMLGPLKVHSKELFAIEIVIPRLTILESELHAYAVKKLLRAKNDMAGRLVGNTSQRLEFLYSTRGADAMTNQAAANWIGASREMVSRLRMEIKRGLKCERS